MVQEGLDFGPNHAAVADLLLAHRSTSPYRHLGEPTSRDASLTRVGFSFLVDHRHNPEHPWEGNLATAEGLILQAVRESERWAIESLIQSAVFRPQPPLPPDCFLDELLISLDETHGTQDGFCIGTNLFPHELFYDFSLRILAGASMETALTDVLPDRTLFRSLHHWLLKGHLPYGWQGVWPNGSLVLW
jgi:hypothetical protein